MTTPSAAGEALLQFLYLVPIGLLQTTLDGTVEMMNPRAAQLLMPIASDAALDNLFELLEPVAPQLRSLAQAHDADTGVVCESLRFDVEPLAPGQAARVYVISMMKIDEHRLMCVLDDITVEARREEATAVERLWRAARVDATTQMPNRLAVAEWIGAAIGAKPAARGRMAVLLIACQRLSEIGESFGEDIRHQVVDLMARRLRAVLRPRECVGCAVEVDQIAARTGDEEFTVLLQQLAHVADATHLAQRIVDALRQPYTVGDHTLHCAIDVGIVCGAFDGRDGEQILRDAGLAVRESRLRGGSSWVEFDPTMRERAIRRGSIEMELRRGLAAGELFVVYQPIVALQSPEGPRPLVGVEALVRWRHPTRGIVPPVDFIGIAEEVGLIAELGRFVLERACDEFGSWTNVLGASAPGFLAVNLSRAQLVDGALVADVDRALARSGIAPHRLQLEVTESLAAQDDRVRLQLERLKRSGLTIALDDFGTGYSSLSSLHLLPVDTVKIDRSFVMLADSSPHHRVLIEATIRVARSLGMNTVAEGIETDAQEAIVRVLGCDKAQGYRYSRPLSAEEMVAWIAARHGTVAAMAADPVVSPVAAVAEVAVVAART